MLIQKATVTPFFSMPSWLGLPDVPTSRPASMACASGWYKWRVPKSGSHGQPQIIQVDLMIIIETDRNPRWPGDTPCFRTPRYLPYYHEPKSTWRISTHWKQGFTQQKRWVASLTGWFLDQLLQWICAVRGWSILHAVARSLTSNIFEPSPNSPLPPKRKTAKCPGRPPISLNLPMNHIKSLEMWMKFPWHAPDCLARNLPDPSAAHWVVFQGWAPGYTTCKSWGEAWMRIFMVIYPLVLWQRYGESQL